MENKMEENKVLEQEMPLAERFSKKVILKVAKIVKVEQHPGGSLLYILTLNTGDEEERQIVSSIVPFYKARTFEQKYCYCLQSQAGQLPRGTQQRNASCGIGPFF